MKSRTIRKIIEIANKYPNRISYINNEDSLSYNILISKAISLSKILKKRTEKNIIIYGHKESFIPITILASLLANKTYIPIDYDCPKERLSKILKELKDYIIISEKTILNYISYTINSIVSNTNLNFYHNNTAYIIFTSGSSGTPKGVRISYSNLDNFTNWISSNNFLNNSTKHAVLNQANFSFDLSVADFFYSLCNGLTFVAYNNSNDSFSYPYELLIKHNINTIFCTPNFIKLLLLNKQFSTLNYPELNCIYFCGEPLNKNIVAQLFERFPNIELLNAYGPTEGTSAVSYYHINKELLNKYELIPVGCVNNFACNIDIEEDEIVLSGKSVFLGYLNDNRVFKKYLTGDIGFIKEDLLFCKGRKDNQIKFSGYRIELEEIENVVCNINGIDSCLAIPIRNTDNEVIRIDAYVVSKEIRDSNIIKEKLKNYIPKYMIPSNIIFINKLQINSNGKIIRDKFYDN